jgi:membrane fusion protein (multidrug efflux system)
METARQQNPTSPEAPAPAPATTTVVNPVIAPVAAPPRRSRRPFAILGVVAVVALGAIGSYVMATSGREQTDDAQIASDMVPVSARVAGAVVHVRVSENQLVKKGDLLVEIDPADYEARVQQAEAELATAAAQAAAAAAQVQIVDATSKGGLVSARAALSGSTAGVVGADAQVAVSRAAAVRAAADLRKTEDDLNRARTLGRADAIPKRDLEAAEIAFDEARAAKAQADAQVALAEGARRGAQSKVGEAQGRVSQSAPVAPQIAAAHAGADLATARVHSAEAALAMARLQLGYTKLYAPADGYASKLTAHEGQLVSVGQPVIELVPAETYVIANFKETQIGKMRPGQPATIEVDAFPGQKIEGKIESLAGGTGSSFSLLPADNATGNFVKVVQRVPVRIAWAHRPDEAGLLRAGLSADVTVDVRH